MKVRNPLVVCPRTKGAKHSPKPSVTATSSGWEFGIWLGQSAFFLWVEHPWKKRGGRLDLDPMLSFSPSLFLREFLRLHTMVPHSLCQNTAKRCVYVCFRKHYLSNVVKCLQLAVHFKLNHIWCFFYIAAEKSTAGKSLYVTVTPDVCSF